MSSKPGVRGALSTVGFLTPPMLWLGVFYLGSLAVLLLTAFWSVGEYTPEVIKEFTLENFQTILTEPIYRTIAFRTIAIAAVVTVIDGLLALPIAYFMAKMVSVRWQRILVIAILTPLWASYLVKAYAWRAMFSESGPLSSIGIHIGYGLPALVITMAYLWLPFMILPVYAGFQRLPSSLIEASADLGATSGTTFRRVIVPSVFPALVAGSIFTFSLTLGDYVAVKIVGGPTQVLGGVIYQSFGTANDLPFAAALSFIPIVVMLVYLWAVRRTGALENL